MAMAVGGNHEELWRECASWLTRCEVLRSDHKANWPDAKIGDLAYMLRDGVLLCNLLNTLDPGCIDSKDINQKPQMAQFLCLRNIQIFLQTSKDLFGLKEPDTFDPFMLFDLTNFHRVLCTLSKLSNTPKAQKKKIEGFYVHRHGSKEDIYQSLQSTDVPVNRSHLDEEHAEYGSYYSHIKNEEIYQDLCSVAQNAASPPVEKRDHVIKELLDTEKNYVEVLKTLKYNFMRPLSLLFPPHALQAIFKDIPDLYNIHTEFYKNLQTIYSDEKIKLSITFLNFREKFLIYGSYCANLTIAQNVLQEQCDQNEIINQELMKCQTEANNGKFKLRDVLSVPMQRILKYHLLLEKLIEETQRNHEEYNDLKRAREAMLDVATYINEVKRDSDHLSLLKQVQENISDWELTPNIELHSFGHLLKDGELKIKAHARDQKAHMRYVFIFEKIMVLCKPSRNGQFSFKEYLQLSEFNIEDVSNRPVLSREARWSYQWLLVRKNNKDAYTLYARTIDLKRKMMKAIKDAMDVLEPNTLKMTNHEFDLHTFEKPVSCNRCSKFLKGLIYQGYICKKCGISVHKECIGGSGRCSTTSSHSHHNLHSPNSQIPEESLREYLWFAGIMERETANSILDQRAVGTYLLRLRPQESDARYALSLKTENGVRHMRVLRKQVDGIEQYYLSESRFFRSVLGLVQFYRHTSLRESYQRLSESDRLLWPYRQLLAEVIREFRPDPSISLEQLPLRLNTRIVVVSKHQEPDGWWYGRTNGLVGYFPSNCVRIIQEVVHDHDLTS